MIRILSIYLNLVFTIIIYIYTHIYTTFDMEAPNNPFAKEAPFPKKLMFSVQVSNFMLCTNGLYWPAAMFVLFTNTTVFDHVEFVGCQNLQVFLTIQLLAHFFVQQTLFASRKLVNEPGSSLISRLIWEIHLQQSWSLWKIWVHPGKSL